MTDEKQIEEMQRLLNKYFRLYGYIQPPEVLELVSNDLYENNVCKLPENAVVITREELNLKNHEIAYHKEREEMAKTAMFTLRQDTVNEIAELLNEKNHKELADLIKTDFSVKARRYTVESLIDKARKETAREILKWLTGNHHFSDRTYELGFEKPRTSYLIIDDEIEELAKQYGVEVE